MSNPNIKPNIRKKLLFLFAIPSILVLIQLILFYSYINFDSKNFNLQKKEQHLAQAQQLVISSLSNIYGKIPNDEFQNLLRLINNAHPGLDNYRLNFSLAKEPKWPLHFCINNKNLLPEYDYRFSKSIEISCQLAPNLWLNYESKPIFFIYRFAVIVLLVSLLAIIFVAFYIFSIIRFRVLLKKFRRAADRFGIDIDTNPIPSFGTSVVRETTEALNKMQNRIRDLIDTRTKMLAAISHDLRTPITRIRLRASLMDDTDCANKITQSLDEMSIMITEVLSFARDDAKHQAKQKLDLNSLITSIYHDFIDMGYKVYYDPLPNRVSFFGKTIMLKRAITNIINNAIKYAEHVWIKLKVVDNEILIEILDDGPGIPENELTKAFKAFYRSKNSRTKNSTGVGLGLTIAQEIVHNHGGIIALINHKPQGLMVKMCFRRTNSCDCTEI